MLGSEAINSSEEFGGAHTGALMVHRRPKPYVERAGQLERMMGLKQARQSIDRFPNDLVFSACVSLAVDGSRPDVQQVLSQAQAHPHLALALIELQLASYLDKLADIESEARASKENLKAVSQQVFEGIKF